MKYDEINHILHSLGFELTNVKGSHFIYKNTKNQARLTIVAHHKKVKRVYLIEIIHYIKQYGGAN